MGHTAAGRDRRKRGFSGFFEPSSGPHGSQVLYAQNEPSRALAELIQSRLTAALLPENRRVPVPAGKDIYIMSHVQCTAVLVECGFLSHPQELSLLQSADYQKKIASVLTACYLQFYESQKCVFLHGMRQ